MTHKLKITYLLESSEELWGGTKVVFEQAEALSQRGHDVNIISRDRAPDWYNLKVPITTTDRLCDESIPKSDIVIGTYWSTLPSIVNSSKGIPVHLCQGYEAANVELSHLKEQIDSVYLYKIPKLTIAPHMTTFLKNQFDAEVYYVGQMINRRIFYPHNSLIRYLRRDLSSRFNILVVGPFEADVKNIATTLKGIDIAKKRYALPIDVIRASQFPLSDKERDLLNPKIYYYRHPYARMGELYRKSDLFISLSKDAEGFGLPALEAMACGIPAILSNIPSYRGLDSANDYAIFVPYNDQEALAEGIVRIFKDRTLRKRLIKRGLEVARRFTMQAVAERLESAFEALISRNTNHPSRQSR